MSHRTDRQKEQTDGRTDGRRELITIIIIIYYPFHKPKVHVVWSFFVKLVYILIKFGGSQYTSINCSIKVSPLL